VTLKGYNSLRACCRHLGTSMEQEKFFKSSTDLKKYIYLILIIYIILVICCIFFLINNSIKLKYKVTF